MISVFDTSIAAYNSGNQIIMDSILQEIDDLFAEDTIIRLPIEDIGTNARKYNTKSRLTFIGGTNILNGNIRKYRQWDLNLHNIFILKRCLLMGCGWFQYEHEKPTKYTRWALTKILTDNYIHSVRDNYTKLKLEEIGIQSINTGCVTLWRLDPNLPDIKGKDKSKNCVLVFTDYNQDKMRDLKLFEIVKSNYTKVYFYPQGSGDINYVKKLGIYDSLEILRPRLYEFNNILNQGTDYIGTRLHAGIRALQLKQRSLIVGIDNRALEMAKDFNLPVINQNEIQKLDNLIGTHYNVTLNLPLTEINNWKSQFKI